MAVNVSIKAKILVERKTELLQFLKVNLPNVRNFPGCNKVEVFFTENGDDLLLWEVWENIPQHQEYIKFITGNGVMTELISFFGNEPVISYFLKSEL